MSKRIVAVTAPDVTINTTKRIQSLVDAHFFYTGQVTKRQYEWVRAGAIVEVDKLDVPELLSKRLGGKTCCGASEGNVIFEEVGD